MFTEVYEAELRRQKDEFRTIEFMDTVLRAGPIPIDTFPEIFRKNTNSCIPKRQVVEKTR